ncbi:MAG: DUF3054 family protein [Anaerolineales bacterium]|nr:DUF3054 family protein [Anaerolineales bacterium]
MNKKTTLIVGDIVVIIILTIIGFATHGEVSLSFTKRMSVVFFPVIFAWFSYAWLNGLFSQSVVRSPKYLWRVALAFIYIAPLTVILRGILLNAAVWPMLAFVFCLVYAAGLTLWRFAYIYLAKRIQS